MTLIVSKHGTTTRISREPFENEQALQHYILLNPEAIPLEDVAPGTRLFVLGREYPTASGPIDALGIDQEGHPYIIETKLYKNPDKRLVLAQVLDYAAALWSNPPTTDSLIEWMLTDARKRNTPDPVQRLMAIANQEDGAAQPLVSTAAALAEGRFTAVVLMDSLSDHLRNLIRFLNEKSDFRILAVELDYYRYDGAEIAIPRIFGAETRRASGTRSQSANIDPQTAMSAWQEQHGADAASCWQSFLSAVHAANIPRLEVGHYPSGLPYLYLTQTRIGRVSVIRLSSKKNAQLRDELHTNSNRFAADPVANAARANFRAMLVAKVPGAIDAASNGRVYVPVSALPDASSDIIAGLRRLASELET